jgi:phenylacetate-CoA ligase
MSPIPEIERQTPDVIRDFQLTKVAALIHYLETRSPYYKRIFAEGGIASSRFKSWSDFTSLPTTSKDQLQLYNWDFLCIPKSDVVEYTSTSGTLGKPVTIALSANDLRRLAYNEAISFACAEGTKADLYQLMLTLDRQFMAGIAYYEGIRQLGAGLIRVGPGLPALQWETIDRLKPTALVAVPSFLVKLIEYAAEQGFDLNRSSVKKAICIGESLRHADLTLNKIGNRIKQAWDIKLFSTYASTEMQTAFTECVFGAGGHHHPELIVLELLDDSGNAVGAGEPGEITVTTLGVEAMPLLRYRTGDMAHVHTEKCKCGRATCRIGPVLGRKQQMIKLKGTTLYPPAIFDILQQMEGITDYVVEATTGPLGLDELKLHVHAADGQIQAAQQLLQSAFQSRLRVVPELLFKTATEIERLQHSGESRKVKKFIDSRNS